jgi:hypothetical protein
LVCTLRSRPKSCNPRREPYHVDAMEDPNSNPDYLRNISAREVSRLAALIDPAKVVAGGRWDPDARYLDPTILHLVNCEDRLMEEEIGADPAHLDVPDAAVGSSGAAQLTVMTLRTFIHGIF